MGTSRGFRIALAAIVGASAGVFAQDDATPILDALRSLESRSDAKCHSTFCRFEDFVYGTPLSDAARDERGELQKALIRALWSAASDDARAAGKSRVDAGLIKAHIADRLPTVTTPEGDVILTAADGRQLVVSRVRLRQYASIAYSLRAILGVQQDVFLFAADMLPLEQDAVDALKNACDLGTLATLMVADEAARAANEATISTDALTDAWSAVVGVEGRQRAHGDVDAVGRRDATAVILRMVEEKLAAYEAYNEIPRANVGPLLLVNTQRFYARYPVPHAKENRDALLDTVNYTVDVFLDQLLTNAGDLAKADDRSVIRAADASAALHSLTPHIIDDFEDAHFFYHLGDEAVVLEAYDTDSLRDLGLHWWFLGRAYNNTLRSYLPVDPFAAEVVTEGVSQYVVLLLRLSGAIAESKAEAPVLLRSDIGQAKDRIIELARRHHETPERAAGDTALRSAAPSGDAKNASFVDATASSGVQYQHRTARWLGEFRRNRFEGPPTFSGGGVAAEDVNGDGRLDLVFVGGGGVDLYLAQEGGAFRDATSEAGVSWTRDDGSFGEARQPIIADFDNDGNQDLLVTYANDAHRLYRGLGDGRFEDVTDDAGLGGEGLIGGPATVFDMDGDGLLDIYICYFGNYLEGLVPTQDRDNRNALPNALLRNTGGFTFEDVTAGDLADTGWAQAVSHLDIDADGDQDIFIANDFGRNAVLENRGGGVFRNIAAQLGVTPAYHSMNVGVADLNDDGYPDVYESNIALIVKDNKYVLPDPGKPLKFQYDKMATSIIKESNVLWMSQAGENGLDRYERASSIERGESSTGWAWDAEFFDYDLDGDDDLYVLNGSNEYLVFATKFMQDDSPESERPAWQHLNHDRESNVFYVNDGGMLRNRSSASGAAFYGNSRAAAYLDWDDDGDLDIAVNNFHAPVTMLENTLDAPDRHWLKIRLVGDPAQGSNRDAIGAHVLVTTDNGGRIHRFVLGGSGFLSMEPRLLHVGLGEADAATVTIRWPNGEDQVIEDVRADQVLVVRQGD